MPRNSDPGGRGRRPAPQDVASGSRERTVRRTDSSGFQWTDDDFRSFETRAPRTSGTENRGAAKSRPREKRPRSSQSTQKRRPSPDRRTSPPRPGNADSRGAPAAKKKKRKKRRIPKSLRHFLIVAGFLVTIAITILVAVTLVFKVDTITVTGSNVYSDEEIRSVCDYHMGDSLFFLSTTDKEEKLQNELPYVEQAKITRKIPGTVQIEITTVKVVASVSYEGQYVYIDSAGKIVELNPSAAEGTILVKGLEMSPPVLSTRFQAADTNKQAAYTEIIGQIVESEATEEITQIDLQDIYNIKIVYQNRIEFLMGNAADLSYKLRFALSAVRDTGKVSANAQGSLDLSYAKETNRATWDADYSNGYTGGTSGAPGTGDALPFEPFASNPGRGGDIPNSPYTGKAAGDDGGLSENTGESSDGESHEDDSAESESDSSDTGGDSDGDYTGDDEDYTGGDEGNEEDDGI